MAPMVIAEASAVGEWPPPADTVRTMGRNSGTTHGDGAAEETHETAQQNQDASDRGLERFVLSISVTEPKMPVASVTPRSMQTPLTRIIVFQGTDSSSTFFFISQAQQSADTHCSDNGQHLDIEQSEKRCIISIGCRVLRMAGTRTRANTVRSTARVFFCTVFSFSAF